MNNLKKYVTKTSWVLLFVCFTQSSLYAALILRCYYYQNIGTLCYYQKGNCNNYHIAEISCEVVDPLLIVKDDGYIYQQNGRAFVVSGGLTRPLMSDAGVVFFDKLEAKYANVKMTEEAKKQVMEAKIAVFLKTDKGVVSKKRFREFVEESGLPIRTKDGKPLSNAKN